MDRQEPEKSHPFYVYSGLLSPKHVQQIGSAWAVFLWCLNKTTFEEQGIGYVQGERQISADEIREDIGGSRESIYRHLNRLYMYGYINFEGSNRGYYIQVLKSKRWKKTNPDLSDVPEQENPDLSDVPEQENPDLSDVPEQAYIMNGRNNHKAKATMNQKQPERKGHSLPGDIKNLDLDKPTPTNRWLKRYQHHRPTAGHPLATLNATQIDDARERVADLIDWVGEDRAGTLLDNVFSQHPKPVSVKQALMKCQQLQEQAQKDTPPQATTPATNGLSLDDRRRYVFKNNWHPDTGKDLPEDMTHEEKEALVYATP